MTEETQQLSFLQRLIGVITNPRATFEDIDRKPHIALPLIIIGIINMIITLPVTWKVLQITLKTLDKMGNIPPDALETTKAITKVTGIIGGAIGGFATPVLMALIIAALIKLITVFTGDDSTFKNLYCVNLYATVPLILGTLVRGVIMFVTNPISAYSAQTSLALFLPAPSAADKPGILFTLLASFDLFSLWHYVLAAIATAVVLKISNKKSAIMVVSIFLLFVLLSVGMAALVSLLPTAPQPK